MVIWRVSDFLTALKHSRPIRLDYVQFVRAAVSDETNESSATNSNESPTVVTYAHDAASDFRWRQLQQPKA